MIWFNSQAVKQKLQFSPGYLRLLLVSCGLEPPAFMNGFEFGPFEATRGLAVTNKPWDWENHPQNWLFSGQCLYQHKAITHRGHGGN